MRAQPTSVPVEASSIKRARIANGVTVKELARRLGVTAGAVSQMERSEQRGGIRLATLQGALDAIGGASDSPAVRSRPRHAPAPFDRREDRVAFELHRAVAARLIDDPDGVRRVIPGNVAQLRRHVHGPVAQRWLDRWESLADASVGVIIDAMLATDELGVEMRQNSPFMGVLSQEERLEAIRRAAVAGEGGALFGVSSTIFSTVT